MIKISKRKYFHDYFGLYRGNASKTWIAIKNMTGNPKRRKKQTFNAIKIGNALIKDEQLISNYFNNFFNSVALNLESELPQNLHERYETMKQ